MGARGVFTGQPTPDVKIAVISDAPELVLVDEVLHTSYDVVKKVAGELDQIETLNQSIINMSEYIPNIDKLSINGTKGISGNGFLVDDPTISLDLSTVDKHTGTIDLYGDLVVIHDKSAAAPHTLTINEFRTAIVADITKTVGAPSGRQDMGMFTGSTIPDNLTVRDAIQALESHAEAGFSSIGSQIDAKVAASASVINGSIDTLKSSVSNLTTTTAGIAAEVDAITLSLSDVLSGTGGVSSTISDIKLDIISLNNGVTKNSLDISTLQTAVAGKASIDSVESTEASIITINEDLVAQALLIDTVMAEILGDDELPAPTNVELTQDGTEPEADGKVDIAVFADWDDMGPLYKNYEVEYQRSDTEVGGYVTIDNKKTKNSRARFSAKTTKWQRAKVRGFSLNGTPGEWSGWCDPIKPSKKAVPPEKAVITGVVGRRKGNKISTEECEATDYFKTRYWRYNTLANATADTSGSFLGGLAGEVFIDQDDLDDDKEYWYRAAHVDKSKSVGAKSDPVSSWTTSAETSVPGPGSITDEMLATTAPGIVAAPGLSVRQRKDSGGELKTQIIAAWTAPASDVPIKSYEVRIYDGTDFDYRITKNLSVRFEGIVGYNYVVSVQAISTFGVPSGFVNSNNVTPGTISTSLNPPGAISLKKTRKRTKVSWTIPSDKDFAYAVLKELNGTAVLYQGHGSFWVDEGPEYTGYELRFFDKQGNYTDRSMTPANSGGGQSSMPGEVDTGDIVDYAVTSTKLAPNSVTSGKIAANSISRSELQTGAGGATAITNIAGSNSGSVSAGAGASTVLTVTYKATASYTASVTLGGKTFSNITHVSGEAYSFTTRESGGGGFSFSKSNGAITDGQLTAATFY